MVSTRACTVESKSKGKKNENPGVKDIRGGVKIKMEANNPYASCSNDDSEEEEQNVQKFTRTIQSGSALKVTLKKTRSCSSSSRESAQSFEVVKSVPATYGSNNSGEEDDDDQKDLEHDELDKSSSSDKQNDDETMEKESDDDSQSVHSSGKEDDGDRTTGSPQESVRGQVSPADSDTEVSKLSINKVVDLKTEEIPQNSATVKTEEIKLKIKSLKEELLKEADQEDEVVILKEDYNNEQASKTPVENGVEKKEAKENVKEQKFKVNVRSFDDLAAPHTANLINMPPPAQIETSPNFLTQNGATFPPFINLTCNVCGITFDTSELLTEHKITLKHLKCSYKECEPLLFTSLQELMDHQRLLHNIMPSSVQQLEHQVQRLPTMGYEQQIQPGRPLTDNLPPPSGVPNMYTQTLRMPMQRGMRPIVRQTMPQLISNRGRGSAIMRGRAPLPGMMRGSMKRSVPMPVRQTPPMKRVATDRNNINSAPPIVKSLSESLTKSIGASSKSPVTQKDVVNLLGKRGLTISTVDTTSNISIPAGLSLNSAVSIIPTSPSKKLDTVDLTGPDKPRSSNSAAQYYPCVHCAKTFLTVDSLNEHISLTHKSAKLAFKCNLCGAGYPNSAGLNQHKQTYHKGEMAGPQYVIPVIDVNRPGSVARLQSLGITNYLPVGQLNHQGGEFGLPIMNIMRPGSLDGLGATNYFNLGPIKKFTKY